MLENSESVLNSVLPSKRAEADSQAKIDAAIKTITSLCDDKELRIVRDSATVSHIVIPVVPVASACGNLNDEQLEHVAGGKGTESTITTTASYPAIEPATADIGEIEVSVTPCLVT